MRVLIADDHALFRDGLRSLLEARGIEVVAEARTGAQAVQLVQQHLPDVVLMDLQMPEMTGLEATRLISALDLDTRIVVLTASDSDADLFDAIKSGAHGYLPKDLEADQFFALIEGATKGEPALTPSLARKVLGEFAHPASPPENRRTDPDLLTPREQEVLELLVAGITSNRDLAGKLSVSENTIKYHLRNILDKLHLQNRAQVIAFAVRHGLVKPADSGAD